MKVKLVSYTTPSQNLADEGLCNLQDLIAYCARVSNPNNQLNTETAPKLIRYLMNNSHWSVFEMVSVCLEISTTRDIARQILRHRSFSFQEFSQRYANPVQDLSFEVRETRLQDVKNRQNSVSLDLNVPENRDLNNEWIRKQQELIAHSKEVYTWAVTNGIAKEQSRAVLPEGNTESRMYMNGTLRSWVHYIQLRSGNGTQREHAEVAIACAEAIKPIFPMITEFITE